MSQTTTKEHNNKKEAAQKKRLQQVLIYVFGKAHFAFGIWHVFLCCTFDI